MAGVNVRFLQKKDKPITARAQQSRDERIRREREERAYAHEAGMLATKEAGADRRTQATGEFGLEDRRMAGQSALRTGAQAAKSAMAQTMARGESAMDQARFGATTAKQAAAKGFEYGTAGRAQAGDIASQAAEQTGLRQAEAFSRQLGGQAYLGGQGSDVANQITSAGQFPVDYSGLKPFATAQPKSYERIAPVYDTKSLVPRMLEPGGTWEKSTGTMDYDANKRSAQALVRKMEEEELAKRQGLGR